VDKTAIAKQRKGYSNAKAPSVEEEEANDAPAAEQAELSGDQAVDLENGKLRFLTAANIDAFTLIFTFRFRTPCFRARKFQASLYFEKV
jgi:hypothetical protein